MHITNQSGPFDSLDAARATKQNIKANFCPVGCDIGPPAQVESYKKRPQDINRAPSYTNVTWALGGLDRSLSFCFIRHATVLSAAILSIHADGCQAQLRDGQVVMMNDHSLLCISPHMTSL
jgi:hypothetical protein